MIRLRFRWDEYAFLRANRINDLHRTRKGPYRHLRWLFLALFLYALAASTTGGHHGPLLLTIILAFYWCFLRWPVNRYHYRRKFRLHAAADKDVEIAVDEKGFRGGTDSSRGEFSWETVTKVVEASDGFLLLQYPVFYWIPLSAFSQESDRDWFRGQAQEKAGDFLETSW